jgi:hypothetical protein
MPWDIPYSKNSNFISGISERNHVRFRKYIVLERLNFRQNGQINSKNHKFSSKPLKKLISGFTPEVIYKIRKVLLEY